MGEGPSAERLRARYARNGGVDACVDWSKVAEFGKLLRFYGRSVNLVGDPDGLERHLLEGVWTGEVGGSGSWVDVGAGGGLPGVVVGCLEGRSIWLVEPRARRADFLELACGRLGLDARVVRARWEDGAWIPLDSTEVPAFEHLCTVATSRAVWDPKTWLRIGGRVLGGHGTVVTHEAPGPPLGPNLLREKCSDAWAVRAYAVSRETLA